VALKRHVSRMRCSLCITGEILSDVQASEIQAGASESFERALVALSKRSIRDALDLLHRAERSGYDPDQCAAYRWNCWMLAGRFEKAWRESDEIVARGRPDPHRLWDGLPFVGKRVMIRCLHGLGDAIQFIRYVRLIRKGASRVTVQTHPELVSLFRGIPFVDDVISWSGEGCIQWDQQIEVMELPRAFRTTVDTVPAEVPYLTVEPGRREHSRVAPRPGKNPRVGLQWRSGDYNPERSIAAAELNAILKIPGIDFYTFQRGPHRAELHNLDVACCVYDVSGESPEIVEAAADLMNIDLLITADTMLAHLAGALGVAVWVLLPFAADWRWMLDRADTPWYPTMKLFRQPSPGDWEPAVRQMVAGLPVFFSQRNSGNE
jgi:hypothetical protein